MCVSKKVQFFSYTIVKRWQLVKTLYYYVSFYQLRESDDKKTLFGLNKCLFKKMENISFVLFSQKTFPWKIVPTTSKNTILIQINILCSNLKRIVYKMDHFTAIANISNLSNNTYIISENFMESYTKNLENVVGKILYKEIF